MAKTPRAPCPRTYEQVDYGDGPLRPRGYVMTCTACGREAWEHRDGPRSFVHTITSANAQVEQESWAA